MINKIYLFFLGLIIEIIDYPNKLKIKKFFKKNLINKDLIIIDIGAHKGETINFFLDNFNISKLYAFEPNKDLQKILSNNKKFKSTNIELFNYGVGNETKDYQLNVTIDTLSSTFNDINTASKYYLKKKKILSFFSKKETFIDKLQQSKIITLNDFLKKKDIHIVDVLKIDTEGFEFNVLRGLSNSDFKKIRFIYFEHHFDTMIKKNYNFSDINSILKKNNFSQRFKLRMSYRKSFEYIYENSQKIR